MKLNTTRLLATPLILAQLFAAQAYSAPKETDPAEYWKQSGITLADFSNSFLNHCYESSKMFLICVNAMSTMASGMNPPAVVASEEEKILDSSIGELIQSLGGGLNLYQQVKKAAPAKEKSVVAIWKEIKEQRAMHLRAVDNLFAASTQDKTSFVDTLALLKTKVLVGAHKDDDAVFAAYLYNVALAIVYDPHTRIQTAAELNEEMASPDSSFVGIGAMLGVVGELPQVNYVLNGGAMKAGMHAKDVIVEVDGKSTSGMKLEDVIKMLKGNESTQVNVKVKRGDKFIDLAITRSKVVTANVEYSVVQNTGTAYGYIKLRNFMDRNASQKISNAIADLKKQSVKGFIIDLRGNGGGLLNQAVSIGSLFMGKEKILSVKDLEAKQTQDYYGDAAAITDLPVVALIDSGSASASEILSGAIQDLKRGWIVGERSFGKGTVQAPFQFDDAGKIVLYKTIQRFYQPSGKTNQVQGIIPDFAVDPFPGATEEDRFAIREEDEYTNALPSIGKKWEQPRPAEVKKVSNCRTKKGQADAIYKQESTSQSAVNGPDYRLLVAQDILNCAK